MRPSANVLPVRTPRAPDVVICGRQRVCTGDINLPRVLSCGTIFHPVGQHLPIPADDITPTEFMPAATNSPLTPGASPIVGLPVLPLM